MSLAAAAMMIVARECESRLVASLHMSVSQ